jgi:hypothetical protein
MVSPPTTMKITYKTANSRFTSTDLLVVFGREGKSVGRPSGVTIPPNAVSSFGGAEREVRLTDATAGAAKQVLMIGVGGARIPAPPRLPASPQGEAEGLPGRQGTDL